MDKYERRNYAVIVAAIVSTLVVMLGGMISGLILAVRTRHAAGDDKSRQMAEYVLTDSAYGLRGAMSALRLCNEQDPARSLASTGLVHAVRAEAALECKLDDWAQSRDKEAFLNDISVVLHTYTPERAMSMADKLYEYSEQFYSAVTENTDFVYDGELLPAADGEPDDEVTEADKESAKSLVTEALNVDRAEYVGDFGGHIEFYIERDGTSGYAVVCKDKITEFSFMRDENGDSTDTEQAEKIALADAEACGYADLAVKWSAVTGRSVSVVMCRSYDGALACDDYATAVVFGGKTVAFTAGGCDHEHKDIPSPRVDERSARSSVRSDGGEGRLVVRTMNGKERICYEYTFELEDGVHYVYVCAESGKQIDVK